LELSKAALTFFDATFAAVLTLNVGACVLAVVRPSGKNLSWKLELAWSALPAAFVLGLWISATRFGG
jgi:hypothetical protein